MVEIMKKVNQCRNCGKQTLCQSHNQLQGGIKDHRKIGNQTFHDGNNCLHRCQDKLRKCRADTFYQRNDDLNGGIHQKRKVLDQRVYDGHHRFNDCWDQLRYHRQQRGQHLGEQVNHSVQ